MPDLLDEIKAFDETKAGVKGLVDAGVARIPRFFRCSFADIRNPSIAIPLIDLQGDPPAVVDQIRQASETFGFFQILNHGVPQEVLDEMRDGVRRFNEQDMEAKAKYYTRDLSKRVIFNSNFDLYQAPAANWRDTLFCVMGPEPLDPQEIPAACRQIIIQYTHHIQNLGDILFELLSLALGLHRDYLREMECSKGIAQTCHYYPPCPEPHLTLGASKHSDPGFLTVLQQDHIEGLQVLHQVNLQRQI